MSSRILKTLPLFSNHDERELRALSRELLAEELPILQDQMKYQAKLLMVALSELATATELDQRFVLDPVGFLDDRKLFTHDRGQLAPGVEIAPDELLALVDALRKKRESGASLPADVMSVHTDSSTRSYVREDRRTGVTFEASTVTGTERRAIMHSETRTSTVTSGRGALEFSLRRPLIDPSLLDEGGEPK